MSTSSSFQNGQNESSYVIDAENPAELARLMHQDRLLAKVLGLFPESLDLSGFRSILDIGCGPGGWALEVANRFPSIQVTGFDISVRMIEYAQAQAEAQQVRNARFTVMNALKPLDFASNSFDLVNARAIGGFMPRTAWPGLLQECRRIIKPGGFICLTEGEFGGTNGPLYQELNRMIMRAMYLAGYGFSPDGYHYGITFMLRRLLDDAGYQNIQGKANFLDYSAGTEAHEPFYQNVMVASKLVQPFLLKMKATTQEEVDQLYQRLPAEMLAEDFCALWFYLTAWGQKQKDS